MAEKIKVAILFGGRSAEHEVSLRSAQNIVKSLDKDKYEPVLIGIDKKGKWHYHGQAMRIMNGDDPKLIEMYPMSNRVVISQNSDDHLLLPSNEGSPIGKIDVIFPVLHGMYGEDGAVQGLAKLANLPCVGPGILGSAVGMDKDIMKRILRDSDIGVADFVTIKRHQRDRYDYDTIAAKLGRELYVKPVNLGSSVGISKVDNAEGFEKALDLAFEYDTKVLIEEKIVGREIEISVLGNNHPKASIPGEIIPKDGFYSYENKYLDEHGAVLAIPAKLDEYQVVALQELAIRTYELLECAGMTRVDFFLKSDDTMIINEVNTIPGFTSISMYPSLWEHSGISKTELVDQLIQLAIEKHAEQNALKTTVSL